MKGEKLQKYGPKFVVGKITTFNFAYGFPENLYVSARLLSRKRSSSKTIPGPIKIANNHSPSTGGIITSDYKVLHFSSSVHTISLPLYIVAMCLINQHYSHSSTHQHITGMVCAILAMGIQVACTPLLSTTGSEQKDSNMTGINID